MEATPKPQNKTDTRIHGSYFNRLLAAFKATEAGSTEEKSILIDMVIYLILHPEMAWTCWVDTPSYLKGYIPLVVAFKLADEMNSLILPSTQSAAAIKADNSPKTFVAPKRLREEPTICFNCMAIPGLNRGTP